MINLREYSVHGFYKGYHDNFNTIYITWPNNSNVLSLKTKVVNLSLIIFPPNEASWNDEKSFITIPSKNTMQNNRKKVQKNSQF